MKDVSSQILTAFKRDQGVSGSPTVTIEWNMNRFGSNPVMSNPGGTGKNDPSMPLKSLVDPDRPEKKGAMKAYVEPGKLNYEGLVTTDTAVPLDRRSYVSSAEDKYQYWVSNSKSSTSPNANSHYNISGVSPTVVYSYGLNTNKLVALFETSHSTPRDIRFYVTEDGTSWTRAGGTYQVDSDGLVELYLQDDGSWSETTNFRNLKRIRGMRVTVAAMVRPGVRCHMIEMGLRTRVDFTDRLSSFDTTYEMSETSFILPFGKCSSNVGNVVLSNHDGVLDNDRTYTPYYGMMNTPAKVRIDTTVKTSAGEVTVRQGTMFVTNWGDQNEDTRTLSLEDGSYFLKKKKPPELLLDRVTAVEAAWRILDSVGFTNFKVVDSPYGDAKIKYYWTDPETTVWEHLQALSEQFQIAIFFDEWGSLRIQSRRGALDPGKSNAWVFDGAKVTSQQASDQGRPGDVNKYPDIEEISKPSELYANKVKIAYTKTDVTPLNKFQPKMETVWEPDETVALRSATLISTMTPGQTYGVFGGSNFAYWPYSGMLQINGEMMEWSKKRYTYYGPAGYKMTKYIASDEEREALDALNPAKNYLNKFDGCLYFGSKRGINGTVARTQKPEHDFHTIRTRHKNGTVLQKAWYAAPNYAQSTFDFKTTKAFTTASWTTAFRGKSTDAPPKYAGTSIRFANGGAYSHGSAGMFFGGGNMDAGYYVELSLTSAVGKRKLTNEIAVYTRSAAGNLKRIGKGAVAAVTKGQWYDLDVKIDGFKFAVSLNGIQALEVVIPPADRIDSTKVSGTYGLFARGSTHVSFEYLYASNSIESEINDDATRADLIGGGYRSNYYNKLIYQKPISERLSRWSEDRMTNNAGFAFDEFGTVAHEVREFDVKFDPKPVTHSRLYLSNQWMADCVEYNSTPTGAKFTVVSKGRRGNAVLNGDDSTLYGSENVINQRMLIYGRLVKQEEEETITVENEKSIRRVGEEQVDITSPWVQTEAQAKFLGDWITEHWQDGSEVISITSFGNPFVEMGDVVGVSYARKSMYPQTHRYFVTSVANSFNNGLKTTFQLQKVSSP